MPTSAEIKIQIKMVRRAGESGEYVHVEKPQSKTTDITYSF